MEKPVPKLPAYMFKRPNGSYRYKRNVPKKLVKLFSKKTLYRKLGNTYAEAIKNYPHVHSMIESLFEFEANKRSGDRALNIIQARLGDDVADMVRADRVPTMEDVEISEQGLSREASDECFAAFTAEEEGLIDLAEDLRGQVNSEILNQIKAAKTEEEPLTLARVLDEYAEFKSVDGVLQGDLGTRLVRLRKELTTALSKTKFNSIPITEIKRKDANAFRDLLLGKMAANSVQRNIGIVKAAVNFALKEHDLNIKNPFAGLNIKGAGASKTDRLPITEPQMVKILPEFADSQVANALFLTLADTGARMGEIVGLEKQDVDVASMSVRLRPNSIRGLKTKSSHRVVPLSQRAMEALQKLEVEDADTSPMFPSYARPRGSDAASQMMMKRLRRRITDKKISMHSLRHRMKDQLRNTGCPEHLSLAILGHSSNSVAANYGAGYSLELMRAALEKVWDA
jgi:integrase